MENCRYMISAIGETADNEGLLPVTSQTILTDAELCNKFITASFSSTINSLNLSNRHRTHKMSFMSTDRQRNQIKNYKVQLWVGSSTERNIRHQLHVAHEIVDNWCHKLYCVDRPTHNYLS
jgi:hypothetical protein